MSETSLPQTISRYFRDNDYAYNAFESGQLWFSNVTDFNDPFDVLPAFGNVASQITEQQRKIHSAFTPPSQDELESILCEMTKLGPHLCKANFTNKNGVVCFSAKPDSIVMWAHYASYHQGFVLEFDANHRFFSAPSFQKVDYNDTEVRPRADDPDRIQTVFTKGKDWKDEEEFRLILPRERLKQLDGKEGHYADLPVDAIKAVYFGCRMLPANRDKLLKLLQQPRHKNILPFQMFPDTKDYRLIPERWSESVRERADFFFELERIGKEALNSPNFSATLEAFIEKRFQ